jgi:hypothetical protein
VNIGIADHGRIEFLSWNHRIRLRRGLVFHPRAPSMLFSELLDCRRMEKVTASTRLWIQIIRTPIAGEL